MIWNGDIWDFKGRKSFQEELKSKIEFGLNGRGNKFSKAFEMYLKIAKSDGMESQQEVLRVWNKLNGGDDVTLIMDIFIKNARPDWFLKNKMEWQGAGDDNHGWTYHEAKWEKGSWIYVGNYFDSTDSWDDWDD